MPGGRGGGGHGGALICPSGKSCACAPASALGWAPCGSVCAPGRSCCSAQTCVSPCVLHSAPWGCDLASDWAAGSSPWDPEPTGSSSCSSLAPPRPLPPGFRRDPSPRSSLLRPPLPRRPMVSMASQGLLSPQSGSPGRLRSPHCGCSTRCPRSGAGPCPSPSQGPAESGSCHCPRSSLPSPLSKAPLASPEHSHLLAVGRAGAPAAPRSPQASQGRADFSHACVFCHCDGRGYWCSASRDLLPRVRPSPSRSATDSLLPPQRRPLPSRGGSAPHWASVAGP